MKKILVAGASVYGLENISDDAMLYSWLFALRKRLDISVTLMLRHIPTYLENYPVDQFIENLDYPSKALSANKRFRGFNQSENTLHLQKILTEVQKNDLLVIGGDPFIEITLAPYKGILPYTELLIMLAKFSGTPVLLHGIHFGRPPVSEVGVTKMQFCLENVRAITTRSSHALAKLKALLQADRANEVGILHTDDAYGLLESMPTTTDHASEAEVKKWVCKSRRDGYRVAIVTIRTLYWLWNNEKRENFICTMAQFLRALHEEEKLNFIFLPHCTYGKDHHWEDDRSGHKAIVSLLDKNILFTIEERIDVSRIPALFELADLAIGNRRHTGIFAGLKQKPFMLFGERLHVAPIYDDYAIPGHLFVEYDELSEEKLMAAYRELMSLKNRDRLIKVGNQAMIAQFNAGIDKFAGILK